MADTPIFIVDNWLSIYSANLTTSITPDTGHGLDKLTDGLHYTYFKKTALNGTVDFDLDPPAIIPKVDCVVIDCVSRIVCTLVSIEIDPDGAGTDTLFNKAFVLEEGPNLIRFTESRVWDGAVDFRLRIVTNYAQDLKIRHLWLGKGIEVDTQPGKPFDPTRETQVVRKLDSESGFTVLNAVESSKRLLEATFNNIYSTNHVAFQKLKEKCWRKAQPFYFCFRPDTKPLEGGTYYFDQDDFNYGYQEGSHRSVSIRALGDISPDRTVTAEYGGYLKSYLDFESGDNDYCSFTRITLGVEFSVEAWVDLESFGGGSIIQDSSIPAHKLKISASQIRFEYSGAGENAAATISLSTGVIYHIVMTRSGTTVKFYIDGVLQTNTANLSTSVSTAFARLGYLVGDTSPSPFDGKMYIVRLYNRALNETEVTQLYNNGAAQEFLKNITIRSWEMRERAGTTVDDEILPADTARRLTISGATWPPIPP